MTVSTPVVWVIGDVVHEFEPSEGHEASYRQVAEKFEVLGEAESAIQVSLEFADILLEACSEFIWIAKDIRSDILNLMDQEATDGTDPAVLTKLQSTFDMFNGYVRDNMKMDAQEQADFEQAVGNYQDEINQPDDMAEAYMTPAVRKKTAAVVRTKPDGSKQHKFPIPDKAHAKAALAFIHQSDLTPAEKAKVRKKAHGFINVNPTKGPTSLMGETTQNTSESDTDMMSNMEAETQLLDISEAVIDLAKGELEVTFLKPGFNKSGYRYYTKGAIQEAVDNGMFNNLKMFMNHQTPQEMNQRPERSLTEWVSTMKETWVDSDGAAKGKVRVVQSWFQSFLKDLQESGALGEIGLSIFAQGKVKPTKMEGRQTNVVEKFQKAMSVDWVTEPGAGGRVDQMWESYQPVMHKEQELNVLASMAADEAIRTLKESRPDVLEALAKQIKDESDSEERLTEATSAVQGLMDKVAALEAEKVEAEKVLAGAQDAAVKDKQLAFVVESLTATELPQLAKDRIKVQIMGAVLKTDTGEFDQPKVEASLKESVDSETAYIASLIKESGGRGIQGLGSTSTTSQDHNNSGDSKDLFARIQAGLDSRMGMEPVSADL